MTTIESALHQTAVLTAVVDAFPIPSPNNFTWSKCDDSGACQLLQTNMSYTVYVKDLQTDLIVRDVLSRDYGKYMLVVRNGIGNPLEIWFVLSQPGTNDFVFVYLKLYGKL